MLDHREIGGLFFFEICRLRLSVIQLRYGDRSEPESGLEPRF